MDTSPKSYHLTAFELINQLLTLTFQPLNVDFFKKIQSPRCRHLLRCEFVTSLLAGSQLGLAALPITCST